MVVSGKQTKEKKDNTTWSVYEGNQCAARLMVEQEVGLPFPQM